ncbi:conserved hypothetical protein [Vibrio nigripulchritudo SO65]|uniref:TadE/TadG family type IV pilus assembly protein n=1 Tax=Vibrio nigripulchritudo TaxID=28173 RepID=UPI0003B1B13E|nr:TadE family protein [Vibrio nigripulchritudo]CCN38170.1 conserved hypothetical protein [Vibrio nigripulchritudo AM115]CCN41590.1 conserved hypothetical protein [Vibrio nigripulchritudo FTn2]CCN64997.1 conserved hypothetical protein [Vibrio nigripulchritudo POn4]CCN77557.1 conserved hypothetical protein [Vibrio nigripulchritudo SO65]
MTSSSKRQKGVISLETAFLMPVFLAITLVFFDVSRLHLQYGLLEHAMRQSLRELLTENWRNNPLTSGKVKRMVEEHGYGFLDSVTVELIKFDSMDALLQVKEDEEEVDPIYRPSDPVYRVTVTLTTELKFSPLGFFEPEKLKQTSTVIISQDLLFN